MANPKKQRNPRNLRNLAGKHPAGWGTPFDLAELAAVLVVALAIVAVVVVVLVGHWQIQLQSLLVLHTRLP
jgi:hypothetical protein